MSQTEAIVNQKVSRKRDRSLDDQIKALQKKLKTERLDRRLAVREAFRDIGRILMKSDLDKWTAKCFGRVFHLRLLLDMQYMIKEFGVDYTYCFYNKY